jgi:hypothetical protein
MKSKIILGLATLILLALPVMAQSYPYGGAPVARPHIVNAGVYVGGGYGPYSNGCYYDYYNNLVCPNGYYGGPYVGIGIGGGWGYGHGYYGRGYYGRGYGYGRGGYANYGHGGYASGGHGYSGSGRGYSGGGHGYSGGGHTSGGGHGGRGR